jgi:hypothetical protein
MTTHIRHELAQIVSAEDLTAADKIYKAVTLDGTICQAASFRKFAGILFYAGPIAGGINSSFVSVAYDGITKAAMGAAVSTVGFPLKVANSGYLVPCASGDMSVGRLFDALASSGDISRVWIDAANLGFFGG